MSEELPRPATPGPWKAGGRLGEIDMSGTVFTVNADNRHVAYCHARPGDGTAIAALPEWIEDRDRWKARAERAEKALAEIEDWGVASFDDDLLKFIRAIRERHGCEAAE